MSSRSERAVAEVRFTIGLHSGDASVLYEIRRSGSSTWQFGGHWSDAVVLHASDLVGLRPPALLAEVATRIAL